VKNCFHSGGGHCAVSPTGVIFRVPKPIFPAVGGRGVSVGVGVAESVGEGVAESVGEGVAESVGEGVTVSEGEGVGHCFLGLPSLQGPLLVRDGFGSGCPDAPVAANAREAAARDTRTPTARAAWGSLGLTRSGFAKVGLIPCPLA